PLPQRDRGPGKPDQREPRCLDLGAPQARAAAAVEDRGGRNLHLRLRLSRLIPSCPPSGSRSEAGSGAFCPKVINVSSEPTCDKFPKVVKGAGVASWGTGRRKKKKKECHERQEHCVGERNDTDHGGFVHRENRIPSKKKGENMSI